MKNLGCVHEIEFPWVIQGEYSEVPDIDDASPVTYNHYVDTEASGIVDRGQSHARKRQEMEEGTWWLSEGDWTPQPDSCTHMHDFIQKHWNTQLQNCYFNFQWKAAQLKWDHNGH